jgi:hypothetical protein
MKTIKIPYYLNRIFTSLDGKKIEENTQLKPSDFFEIQIEKNDEIDEELLKSPPISFYFAILMAQTPIGPQEIRVPIENTINIKQAFENFDFAVEHFLQENKSNIVSASEADLNMIENLTSNKNKTSKSKLIL